MSVHFNGKKKSGWDNMTDMQKARLEREYRARVQAEVDKVLEAVRVKGNANFPCGDDVRFWENCCSAILKECRRRQFFTLKTENRLYVAREVRKAG